ncbi:FAD-dependent oxidoreductase [Geminisphaera colitermitum]|uniref:FAD-dependent oxidoreductase n=1 Tax=Geminisphaera colitermitum TaxID=1148786 RepID=UPI00019655E0|nr:FAD-dependent oxidoreductase [Geminisphaera colitermitum]
MRLPFHHRFLIQTLHEMVENDHVFHGHALPNRKRSWNATNLTGAGKRYAAASPAERRAIECAHATHALGLMWFLQHDPAVPADIRSRALEWGLAGDEFAGTQNLPPQLYVREARRLAGRAVFTEHDALAEPGRERAPVHADSIGITEFSLDSLACTTERLPGTGALCDGQLFQMENSRPGQVPFGVLLPREIDNLLVVTCVSATHVAWGTIRQTPTLMHLAESAAWALVLARRRGVAPANLDVSEFQRHIVSHGIMISFFNDFDMSCPEPWVPAMQLLGIRGFFPDYDAAPHRVLNEAAAHDWSRRAPHVEASRLLGKTHAEAASMIVDS